MVRKAPKLCCPHCGNPQDSMIKNLFRDSWHCPRCKRSSAELRISKESSHIEPWHRRRPLINPDWINTGVNEDRSFDHVKQVARSNRTNKTENYVLPVSKRG